jgi:serine/threonine-protein kinase
MAVEIGQVIDGKYRILSLIGEGGMGAVFAGEHLRLHRRVAIKVLHAAMAQNAEVVLRFEREAQAAGRIGNDHILEVLDLGELPGGDRFMVMEYLEGEPYNARLERVGRISPQQACRIAREILEGLSAAHAAGIVHRDLKPANIFILREKAGRADYVKIIDFGISKFQNVGNTDHKTRTGFVIGTPSYMSPEQARGLAEADERADLYAVGVILYESVSGRLPFIGASPTDLLFQIALGTPPPIQSLVDGLDPVFSSIVHRAMARDPSERFPTAAAFIAALDAWSRDTCAATAPITAPAAMASPLNPPARTPPAAGASGTPWASTNASGASPSARGTIALVSVLAAGIVAVGIVGAWLVVRTRAPAETRSSAGAPAATAPFATPIGSAPADTGDASATAAPTTPVTSAVTLAPMETVESAPAPPSASVPQPRRTPERPLRPPPSAAPSANPAYNPFGHL